MGDDGNSEITTNLEKLKGDAKRVWDGNAQNSSDMLHGTVPSKVGETLSGEIGLVRDYAGVVTAADKAQLHVATSFIGRIWEAVAVKPWRAMEARYSPGNPNGLKNIASDMPPVSFLVQGKTLLTKLWTKSRLGGGRSTVRLTMTLSMER
jgi:hypothetical protein